MLLMTGIPWSMPNADQYRSKFLHWSQCRSMPISANQFWSIPLNRHWEELIGIERQFGSMPWFWSALGIDRGSLVMVSWHTSKTRFINIRNFKFVIKKWVFLLLSIWCPEVKTSNKRLWRKMNLFYDVIYITFLVVCQPTTLVNRTVKKKLFD